MTKLNRRDFLRNTAIIGGGALLGGASPVLRPLIASAQPSTRPLLVVVMDDLMALTQLDDYVIGGGASMPNLRNRLAWNSAHFANAHCASTSCASSRASMWSGQFGTETGVYNNDDRWWNSSSFDGTQFIQQLLKASGWNVHGFGKVFHEGVNTIHHPGNSWTSFSPVPFDAPQLPGAQTGGWGDFGKLGWVRDQPDKAVVDDAVPTIQSMSGNTAVFVGLTGTHLPFAGPGRFFNMYPLSSIKVPNVWPDAAPISDKFVIGAKKNKMAAIVASGRQKELIRAYLAMASFVDEMLGLLLDALPSNVNVVVTSDHGFALGEAGAFSKFTLWEQSTQVPLMIQSDRISEGRIDRPVSLIDLPDTIADLCNIAGPNAPRGKGSLLGSVNNSPVLCTYRVQDWVGGPSVRGVVARNDRWALIRYDNGQEELYNLFADPHQTDNRLLPSHGSHVQGIRNGLAAAIPPISTWASPPP